MSKREEKRKIDLSFPIHWDSTYKATAVLLVLLFVSVGFAEVTSENGYQMEGLPIESIDTAGNRSIERSEILAQIRSRAGDLFSEKTVAEDVERIAKLPGVQRGWYNATVENGKVKLIFVIVERNIVRSIDFMGNKKYKDSTLAKKLDFKKADFLDPLAAEEGRTAVQEYYLEKGFAFSTVTLDIQQLAQGDIVYNINEGPRVRITSIRYTGNEKIKTKDLKKVAKLRTKRFTFWRVYYVEERINKDITNLRNTYYKKGYLNNDIKVEKMFNEDRTAVKLTFVISEGASYTVDNIVLKGNKSFGKDELVSKVKTKEGQIYNKLTGDKDVRELTKIYREDGFINSMVEQNIKFVSENKIDIEYVITENQQFMIGQVEITGNQETQDKVIRRILDEYDFTPGKPYNADIARGSPDGYLEKMVRQTAYTESAVIAPVDSEVPGHKDALVTITEGQTGMIMAGAGVSADSGAIGQLVFEQRNFDYKDKPENFREFITGRAYKGAGQHFRISLEPGTEVSQYSISFTEPYLNDKPVAMSLGASSFTRGRESYDEERLKGYIGFEKRYKNKWRRSISFRAESVDVGNLDWDAPKEIRDNQGKNLIAGIKLGFSRDLTDDKFNPSDGYILNAGYEQVGGDYTFGIMSAYYQRFKTLSVDLADRKTILSSKIYGAYIIGDAPVFEKFYAGGSDSYYGIRGFEYRGVSPRGTPTTAAGVPIPGAKKEDPIGSDWIILANSELTVPLVGDNMSMLFFVDSGMVEEGGVRASVGTGIQILIPQWFGPVPMRFEIATPFMKNGDDETQAFSFSVGRLF